MPSNATSVRGIGTEAGHAWREDAEKVQLEHNLRRWRAGLIQRGSEQDMKQGIEQGIERERALLHRQTPRKFDTAT